MKMFKWFYPLSIFTFFGIINVQAQSQCNPATERASLIDFYNKTNGPNWRSIRWNGVIVSNAPVCPATGTPWPGIKCNTNRCVTHLELPNNGLLNSPTVAVPALNLVDAQVIDLSSNILSGEVNSFSYSLKLTHLNVSNNRFSGALPHLNLQELVELDASRNTLKEPIPPLNLPKLVKLTLNGNMFIGQIPNFDLPKLQILLLQDNNLSGCLPRSLDTFCNRTPATTVNLSNNPNLSNVSFATFCGAQKVGRCACSATTATISNIKTAYCKDDPSVVLTGAPTGGVFKIDGVLLTANTLNPSLLTVGRNYKITYTLPLNSNGCLNEFSQNITITAPCRIICSSFTANLSSDRTSVCQGGSTSLNLSFVGGCVAPFVVKYSDGITTNTLSNVANLQAITITPAADRTYTIVSATDANGCIATIGTSVTIKIVNPTANITGALSFCAGNSTVLTATGGGSYTWTGGSTNAALTVTTAGTYAVTATTNGCPATKSVQVTTTPLPILAASATNVKCNGGSDGQIVASASGGVNPITFSINPVPPGSTQSPTGTFNNLTAQAYTITVKDFNNCSATSVSTVGQPTSLTLSLNPTNATNCTTSNGSIIAIGGGGSTPYAYRWSNGATSATLTNLAAGTYTVTMTDSKGCTTTVTTAIACTPCNLMLNQPTLITACNASAATINVSWSGGLAPYKLTYSGAATNTLTGLTTTSQQINSSVSGNYTITVIDANNCSQFVNFLVTIPTLVSVGVNPTNAINCTASNGSVSAVGSGGTPPYTYRWNNGATTALVSNLAAGTYTLTMTDSKGCTTTASTTIQCSSTCNLVMGQPTVLASCTGQTAQINVSWTGGRAPYNLTYSGASIGNFNGITETAQQLNNLPAGNYSISIVDANNCSQMRSVTVVTPPLLSLTTSKTDASICLPDNGSASVIASGGTIPYTYMWNNGKTTATISALASGTYTTTVTDAAGCTKNQTVTVNSTTDSLTAPLVSVISIGVDSILLGWSTVLNAARYEVQTNDNIWLPANGALRHTIRGLKPSQTVTFKVRGVATSPKCGARITRLQARTENEKCLEVLVNKIPTAFTPGNNGKNDFFDPEQYLSLSGCSSNLKAQALHIFNQWGEIVFKAQPYEKWDGKSVTYQKIVLSGAYYYVLIINNGDKTQSVKGTINLFAD